MAALPLGTHTHTRIHTYSNTHAHTYTQAHTHTYTCKYTCVYMYSFICLCIHVHIFIYIYIHSICCRLVAAPNLVPHTHIRAFSYTHTRIHFVMCVHTFSSGIRVYTYCNVCTYNYIVRRHIVFTTICIYINPLCEQVEHSTRTLSLSHTHAHFLTCIHIHVQIHMRIHVYTYQYVYMYTHIKMCT